MNIIEFMFLSPLILETLSTLVFFDHKPIEYCFKKKFPLLNDLQQNFN